MAELKRDVIELIKNPDAVLKGEEPEIEKVWTPSFISLRVARNAIDLFNEMLYDDNASEGEKFDKLVDFVANEIFRGKVTTDDLYNRMHAPGGKNVLNEILMFVAHGQQTESAKKYLAQKN